MATKATVNETTVRQAFVDYAREATLAVGKDGVHPRFVGFYIVHEVTDLVNVAKLSYKEGRFDEAFEKITSARKWLLGGQRKYVLSSVEKYFEARLEDLRYSELEQDILDGVNSKMREFESALVALKGGNASLEEVTVMYWVLNDAIENAPKLQAERDEHRRKLADEDRSRKQREKMLAKKAREAEEAEKSRQAQIEANARWRQERESFVDELFAGL
ncbi:MAG: hypothetical protein WAX44_04315 [Minisyncoccia bacterium]